MFTLTIYDDSNGTETTSFHENLQLAIWTFGKALSKAPYIAIHLTCQIVNPFGKTVRTW